MKHIRIIFAALIVVLAVASAAPVEAEVIRSVSFCSGKTVECTGKDGKLYEVIREITFEMSDQKPEERETYLETNYSINSGVTSHIMISFSKPRKCETDGRTFYVTKRVTYTFHPCRGEEGKQRPIPYLT